MAKKETLRSKKTQSRTTRLPKSYKGVTTQGEIYGETMLPNLLNKDPRVNYMHPVGMGAHADNKIELAGRIEDRNPKSEKASRLRAEADVIYKRLKTRPRMGDKYVDVDAISYCGGGRLKRRKRAFGGGIPPGGSVGIRDNKFVEGYETGTPLNSIFTMPTGATEQEALMSTEGILNAKRRIMWANFEGKLTDYPAGRNAPAMDFNNPKFLAEMENRGLTKEYLESWQPSNYPEEFSSGGDVFMGAASGAMTGMALGPYGAAAGALIGGVAGWLGNKKEEDALAAAEEEAKVTPIPVSMPRQSYQRAARGGDLTEFTGPRHEDGGIALGGLPVEVEGGETRTGDMIHSDRPENKVTSAMIKKYPVLKKTDKGKTMAEVTKKVHKKFEKRQWDELNDNAAEITMMPFEQISDELSGKTDPNYSFADGGDITAAKARQILSHGTIRGRPITAKQRRFFGAKTKAAFGINLGGTADPDLSTAGQYGQYAPLIASGIDMVGALASGPEKVDYGQIGYTPTNVSHISAESGIKRIRRNYGNAEAKLRKYNPNRYLARMNELAAGEAGAVTDYAGGVQAKNVEATNRANIVDSRQAMQTNMFNKRVAMSEAEANAANRAANQSRISANVANIGTMAGQMARDEKLDAMQQGRHEDMMGIYQGYLDIQNPSFDESRDKQLILPPAMGYNPDLIPDIGAEEDLYSGTLPLYNMPNYRFAGGGNLTHRLRLRNLKSA